MKLRFIPLEERIVLDATALGGMIVDALAPDSGGEDSADAPDSGVTVSESDSDGDSEPSFIDRLESANDSPVNVLVMSSDVEDHDVLADAINENVIAVTYDAANSSLGDLSDLIKNALAGREADTIAFATEGQSGMMHLTEDVYVTEATLNESAELQTFWQDVGALVKDGGRVDLLGCNYNQF